LHDAETKRHPLQVTHVDLENAQRIVALKEAEHRPLLVERFPAWADKVEYWHIDDAPEALDLIERAVMELTARLLGGGNSRQAAERIANLDKTTPRAAVIPKTIPIVRVGRETKGRSGKGMTIISDIPLDDKGIHDLAAM